MDVLRYMRESFTATRVVVRSWCTEDSPDKRLKVKDYLDLSEEMNRRPEIDIFRRFGTLKKYRMTRAMNVVIGSDKYTNEALALQIAQDPAVVT